MLHDIEHPEQADRQRLMDTACDRQAIQELLQNWVIWRDSGDWERFSTVWHEDGQMIATWFRSNAADFIARCREVFDDGMISFHSLGGMSIDVEGTRAIAQSKMQIVQRGMVDSIEVDVTCLGRFVDALEKRDDRWGIVLRQPIYELDRMTPVGPTRRPELDEARLKSFPLGYRHLAYLQTSIGLKVDKGLPGTKGPAVEALAARMRQWLDGGSATCLQG